MNFDGIPQPWATLLSLIVGPLGAIVVLCVIIYFLWKLFREAEQEAAEARTEQRKEAADNRATIGTLSSTVHDLTTETRALRELLGKGGV